MAELNVNELNNVAGGVGEISPYKIYIVNPGDCQALIAERFHMSLEELQTINNIDPGLVIDGQTIRPGQMIQPGQKLLIPTAKYIAVMGENG